MHQQSPSTLAVLQHQRIMEEETLKMESTYQKAAIGEQSAVSKYLHAAPSFPHAYFSATELFIGRHGALSPENSTARLFSAKWFV